MQTNNAALKRMDLGLATARGERLTVEGVVNKAMFLLALVVVAAAFGWIIAARMPALGMTLMIGGIVVGAIVAIISVFTQRFMAPLGIVYALAEGTALGALSQVLNHAYPGIAFTAFGATIAVFAGMFALYRFGIVKVTQRFRAIMVGAILGIMLFYLATFVLSFFVNTQFLFSGGLGIGISLVIVVVAAFSLMLDFDFIDQAAQQGAPAELEWYAAFSLMVTIIWIYLEILRLLAILNSDSD